MARWVRQKDPTRLLHYEQDKQQKVVDIVGPMYTSVEGIIKLGEEENYDKPVIMCEYAHAMGNGPVALKSTGTHFINIKGCRRFRLGLGRPRSAPKQLMDVSILLMVATSGIFHMMQTLISMV